MKKNLFLISIIFLVQDVFASERLLNLRESFFSRGVEPLFKEKLNIESEDIVSLGELLFFDKILSGNKNISCATCHHTSIASVDGLPLPLGTGATGLGLDRSIDKGNLIPRNAPAAFNIGFDSFHTAMWDGRIALDRFSKELKTPEPKLNGKSPKLKHIASELKTLAAVQAMFPVTSHHEMRGDFGENEIADAKDNEEVWKRLTDRLVGEENGVTEYKVLFSKAYPGVRKFNFGHVARAIGAYETKAFRADKSSFDKFLDGDDLALTENQIKGAELFAGKGKCLSCHSGSHFTDFKFHSVGAPQLGPGKSKLSGKDSLIGEDTGMAFLNGNSADKYKFKTPTLRNVELTSPYFHSGVFKDLRDVVRHHIFPERVYEALEANPENYVVMDSVFDYSSICDLNWERNQARLASRSEHLKSVENVYEEDIDFIVEFLESLTDRSFLGRVREPDRVPSGLAVKD